MRYVFFASDAPFDPEGGPMYIRETIQVIDKMDVSDATRQKLYQDNALRLLELADYRGFWRSYDRDI